MKNKFLGLFAGMLAGFMLFCGIGVLAAQGGKSIEAFYRDIRVFVDGGEIVPKDANGKVVEPFIYNGTTYLPIRAVAEALGKDVAWDGENAIAYLGKKEQNEPDAYLSELQYNNYREGDSVNSLDIINGSVTDYNGKVYKSGLLVYMHYNYAGRFSADIDGNAVDVNSSVSYPLNGQYKTLTGKIVLPKSYNISTGKKDNCRVEQTTVIFVGDGEELYRATGVTASMPFSFDISVRGINQLDCYVQVQGGTNGNFYNAYVALTDLALYK